ncbi:MAG: helix-turn-helix domain-containing protein [Capsulimonadaceae bacterium]
MATTTEQVMIERGSDNVFADLGLPDADELLAKSKLVRAISAAIKERKITQKELARLTGIDQSKISQLLNGKISGFSSDRLMHILTKLDQDVVIIVMPRPSNEQRPAYVSVSRSHGL